MSQIVKSQNLDISEPSGVVRAAFAATIGNMLEFYDFITYSFFAIQIGQIGRASCRERV